MTAFSNRDSVGCEAKRSPETGSLSSSSLWMGSSARRSPSETRRLKNLGFQRAEQVRYNERTAGERVNGRLKDEFGGRHVRVRGAAKVMCHCMFGMLALTADQLLRLVT